MLTRLWACVFVLVVPTWSLAQLPSPRLDRIAPLGASIGGKAELEIQGAELEEATLVFEHPGISATPIEGKERFFLVAVTNEVPEGTRRPMLLAFAQEAPG